MGRFFGTGRIALSRVQRGRRLFDFSSFTFTPGPAVTSTGPTYSQLISSYNTTANPWLLNTNFFSVPTNGFQRFVVPEDGRYRIEAAGASGGWSMASGNSSNVGRGGIMISDFVFTVGQELYFVVGQAGAADTDGVNNPRLPGFNGGGDAIYNAGGGGGASDVRLTGTALSDRIIVAGGGGGGSHAATGGSAGYPDASSGVNGAGGTQSSGNALGQGANGFAGQCVGGGGGGYWGGALLNLTHGNTGGGGSSYVDLARGSFVSHSVRTNTYATGYIAIQRVA